MEPGIHVFFLLSLPLSLSPQYEALRHSAFSSASAHHCPDITAVGSNLWASFALLFPPSCMLASLRPSDSSFEMFPELLLSQSCCHLYWPRPSSHDNQASYSKRAPKWCLRARFPFHRPPHQCQMGGPNAVCSLVYKSSSTFLSWHLWVPSTDPPKFVSSHSLSEPLPQLGLPQCPAGRRSTGPLRAGWIRSLIKMQMPDIGYPIQRTVSGT